MHDGHFLSYTDAILRGQTRREFQTFASAGEVAVARFLANGVQLNQTQSSGRAGKIAFLLLG
jgi:hypothetical protein